MKRADIMVYNSDGQIQLAVEVKNKLHAPKEWAIKMHRNLLVHSMLPHTPYFLLALPDRFYLWHSPSLTAGAIDTSPQFTGETVRILAPQLNGSSHSLNDISEQGLELLVTAWLEDLVRTEMAQAPEPHLQWLFDSGLYESIRGGSVVAEALV